MSDIKIRKEYQEILKKSSNQLGISPDELLDYLITQELNYSIAQHTFNQWNNQKKERKISTSGMPLTSLRTDY